MNKIAEALHKKFQEHRVIFWYDEKQELKEQYDEMELEGVQKIHVQNNEFEVKYLINKKYPDTRFLLYFTGEKPANEVNWLLDMELAHYVFHSDREALYLQELGLGYHLKELITEHIGFFLAKERRQKLKEMLGTGDDEQAIRYKMLAVLFETGNVSLHTFIYAHSTAFVDENPRYDNELERFNLKNFYWSEIKKRYNYQNVSPAIYDFLIEVFNANFVLGTKTGLSQETRLLLLLWKDTISYRESFAAISEKIARDTDVENRLQKAPLETLMDDDLFRLTDFRIIHELTALIAAEEISREKVLQYVKQRENKFWYHEFEHYYAALSHASSLMNLVRKYKDTTYEAFAEGIAHYTAHVYEIDRLYRKYIWHYRQGKQNKILAGLSKKVEKVYSNDYLLTYNNNWQKVIDKTERWPVSEPYSQQMFFRQHVRPFTEKKQRLFVIISDALRYECGMELSERIQMENRYASEAGYMVSCLPSYTQLGMASLLPHKEIALKENTETAEVDGMPATGIQGRGKILAVNSGVRATALLAEDFMRMNSAKEGREFVKQYDLIYIYHNRIDKTGDDKISEENVFEAVDEELNFLTDLIKKIANMNGNNMLITSDHGFIYQHHVLEESDFSLSAHTGEVWKENRRFVIGRGLKGDKATKAFNGAYVGIRSDVDILIPKSINRLRVKGAGSRFVHGGATLQEIAVPLIRISKKRQDTTSKVEIDIIKSTDRITTNILPVSFIQMGFVTKHVLARTIKAYLVADDGEILSDQFTYLFNASEGSERQREVKHRFQLSSKASGRYKNQRIRLVLEEPLQGTTKWKLYKEYFYTLNISFTNDFDIT